MKSHFPQTCILLTFSQFLPANKCPLMISISSLHTWHVFGKVVSSLIGYYCGNVDVIPSQNLLIIAKM